MKQKHAPGSRVSPAILSFGEVLMDVFPSGEFLGGAAYNLAAHAAQSGLRSFLYSRVGTDARGQEVRAGLARHGVSGRYVQADTLHPTGWVDVKLDGGEPSYRIAPAVAWDAIEAPADCYALQAENFATLACNTLAQRSLSSRQALAAIRRALPSVPVFYDVNLRGEETPWEIVEATLSGVRWLKLNEEEERLLAQNCLGEELYGQALARALTERYEVETLIVTRGAKGCEIVCRDEHILVQAPSVTVVNTVGAGDAFSAVFLASILHGETLEGATARATTRAAYVVGCPEAVPTPRSEGVFP